MSLEENLNSVQERIRVACERAGREVDQVLLLPVTKTQSPDIVCEAARLGLSVFGENKVQEAKAKKPLCPGRLRWHMIGHLQSNKCRDAVHLFDMIQSVDSFALAQELDKRAEQQSRKLPILLEVNIVSEASKFGFEPGRMLADLSKINALPRLELQGLMTVPPWSPNPERSREPFQRLRDLKAKCEDLLGIPLPHLSMGMSGDFEVAIEEGSTIVRVGTAIFGERKYAKQS